MKNIIKILTLVSVIFITAIITNVCYGASITINAGSTDLTVGSATTLTISGSDIIGKISITSSNPNVISISSSEEWLEGVVTVRATAKSAGSAYITVSSLDTSSATTGEAVSAAAGANITAKEIVNTTITPQTQNNNYTPQNTVADTRSANNYLSSLNVEGYEISPAFNPDTNNYTLSVKSDVSELKLSAIPADNNSKVIIDGNLDLTSGENNVTIAVTAENGYRRVYTIVVTKEKDPNDTDASISKLTINNAKIKGEFDPELLEYMCDDISADITKLDFVIETKVPDLRYEITGNDELKTGINHIAIKVTSRDGSVNKEYKIIVYKTEEILAMQEIEEPVEEEVPSILDKIKTHKKIVIGVGISVLLAIVVVIFVILKKKNSSKEDPNDGWLSSDEDIFENKVNEYVNEELENEKQNEYDENKEIDSNDIEDISQINEVEEDNEEEHETEDVEDLDEPKYGMLDDEIVIRTGSLASNNINKKENELKEDNDTDKEEEKDVEESTKKDAKKKNQEFNIKLDLSSLRNDDDKF